MKTIYDSTLKATVRLDDANQVRGINHLDEYREMAHLRDREAAAAYIRDVAGTLNIAPASLSALEQRVEYLDPQLRDTEYRFSEEKPAFDSATYAYHQTFLNTPVWAAGITTTVKQAPPRIVAATDTSERGIDAKLPPEQDLNRYRQLFEAGEKAAGPPRRLKAKKIELASEADAKLLIEILGEAAKEARGRDGEPTEPRLIRGRFYVYRYNPSQRTVDNPRPAAVAVDPQKGTPPALAQALCGLPPTLPLPPVPKEIRAGHWYLVAELVFRLPWEGSRMNWRMLVDVQTDAVLYLRALTSGVNGLVFLHDPITSSGETTNTPDQSNTVLNHHRDDVVLDNLNPATGGVQALEGSWATLTEQSDPSVPAPTRPAGSDFDYDVRTNGFAAVNAYYHVNRFFQLVSDLGFSIPTYFNGTAMPVEVDHRGLGDNVNARCVGDGDGIDFAEFALADDTDIADPIGIATDWRVVLHELGGHGILYDHVGSANFNFAHSAGDSFAVILNDYLSEWHNGAALDRFILSPFVPAVPRRSDRGINEWSVANVTVTNGGSGYTSRPWVSITGGGGAGALAWVDPVWDISGGAVTRIRVAEPGTGFTSAPTVTIGGGGGSGATATATIGTWRWGGGMDLTGYLSEQILSTTMFRFYRSIGGDASSLARREFAAHCTAYLLLNAVGKLTPMSNPNTPALFLTSLLAADADYWTSHGVDGGAYGKVLTWAFEKQDLNGGAAPSADVYIDDGRAGEYEYLPVHWETTTIWNRRIADGQQGHQEPAVRETNYAYVKIKNRGTSIANDVVVKGYHCKPTAGVLWPDDLQPMTTAELPAGDGTLQPNSTEEKTVGPFEWTPVTNTWGHDCMMMIVSATGDPSNVDKFTAGEVAEDWRLIPNDNNIGQRNIVLAPGGGGLQGFITGLHGKGFWIGNPGRATAQVTVSIELPAWLTGRGWRIDLRDLSQDGARLKSREQRLVTFDVRAGAPFSKADVAAATERDIVVTAKAEGAILGGMVYRIDPELEMPYNDVPRAERDCRDKAKELLECLELPGKNLKRVRVRKIAIDFEMKGDDCCGD